jgi:hypothetical protein
MALPLTAAISYALRCLCFTILRNTGTSLEFRSELHPSELAYLIRPGDSAHCLIVLAVDLLQKGIKSPSALEEVAQLPYEKDMWNLVSAYIKEWTALQAQALVPELRDRNPIKIAVGFWRLRHWLSNTLKNLHEDLVRDPRNLRRYFSPAGLMRVFLSLLASGVKEPFMRDLRSTLLEKKLLLAHETCRKFSGYLAGLACIHSLALLFLLITVSGLKRWEPAVILLLIAMFNGAALRLLAELPFFLPLYEELSLVLGSIARGGFRITVLKFLLKLLRTIFWSIVALFAAFVVALQALCLSYFFQLGSGWLPALVGIAALSLNFTMVVDLAILSMRNLHAEQRSSAGEKLLRRYQMKLRSLSPSAAFSVALSDPQYSRPLSEIVAIYGVETLFLLA